jgi:hypothetical protein
MLIKTADGEKNVSSKGLGGAALGLAIPGTVALVNQLTGGNGLFGGLLNGGNNNCQNIISALESELAREKAERYADSIGIATFKETQSMVEKVQNSVTQLAQFVALLDKNQAVENQRITDNFAFLNNKIDTTDSATRCYVNATFVPGKLVMPLDSICPAAQPASGATNG